MKNFFDATEKEGDAIVGQAPGAGYTGKKVAVM